MMANYYICNLEYEILLHTDGFTDHLTVICPTVTTETGRGIASIMPTPPNAQLATTIEVCMGNCAEAGTRPATGADLA